MTTRESAFARIFNKIDGFVKFPNLHKGDIGVQVGFDLSSKNLVTDVLKMHYRTGNQGLVIGIDPDPVNHQRLKPVIEGRKLNVKLIQTATHSEKKNGKLVLGKKASHNILDEFNNDNSAVLSDDIVEVPMNTLDNIISETGVDYSRIAHINITNNGAEYDTLKGMNEIFEKCPDLNLTVIAGRPGKIGEIDGRPDDQVITEFLKGKGFKCRFRRINESFWWGFVISLLLKRKWVFGKQDYGIVMASRGARKLKWYQSFS